MIDPTSSLIVRTLDGLSTRQAVTAENIANANSPNFRPLRVTFEDALAAAARRGDGSLQTVQPHIAGAPPGERLRLDLELATASATALRYAALTDLLSRQLQMETLAITGNAS